MKDISILGTATRPWKAWVVSHSEIVYEWCSWMFRISKWTGAGIPLWTCNVSCTGESPQIEAPWSCWIAWIILNLSIIHIHIFCGAFHQWGPIPSGWWFGGPPHRKLHESHPWDPLPSIRFQIFHGALAESNAHVRIGAWRAARFTLFFHRVSTIPNWWCRSSP